MYVDPVQSIVIIHRFGICKFPSSLNFIGNAEIPTQGSFAVIWEHVQRGEECCLTPTFSADIGERDAPASHFSSHTVNI